MKRPSSCDSLGALMSICPGSTDEHNQENINPMYTREFQTMMDGLDEEGCVEESGGHVSEKKRRLSVEQVKALEKNFEVENKLEPDRKVKLAQELGLQPRQVAVWFQNRRARWKTKQLERDYGVLKAKYDGLQLTFESLKSDNEALHKEIRELKSKLNGDDHVCDHTKLSMKEEPLGSDTEEKSKLETNALTLNDETAAKNLNFENLGGSVFVDFKDGSSDESDSSAILNEENNMNSPISSGKGVLNHSPHQFLDLHSGSSNTSMNLSFQFSESQPNATTASVYQPQFVKIEEHNFFGEESCSTLFSDDQAPTLHWYCSEDWN